MHVKCLYLRTSSSLWLNKGNNVQTFETLGICRYLLELSFRLLRMDLVLLKWRHILTKRRTVHFSTICIMFGLKEITYVVGLYF